MELQGLKSRKMGFSFFCIHSMDLVFPPGLGQYDKGFCLQKTIKLIELKSNRNLIKIARSIAIQRCNPCIGLYLILLYSVCVLTEKSSDFLKAQSSYRDMFFSVLINHSQQTCFPSELINSFQFVRNAILFNKVQVIGLKS